MENKPEHREQEIDQTADVELEVNTSRRQILHSFGLVSSLGLSACFSENRPESNTKTSEKTDGHTHGRMQNGNTQTIDCGCMPGSPPVGATPGTPPVGATPGTPPAAGVTPPGTPPTTPGTPATPGTPTTPAPTAPQNPGTLASTFTSIGPGSATLTATDMMSTITLSDGRIINAWSFTSGGSGFNNNRFTPGPVVECIENTPMQLTLATMMPHTIHLHGLDVDTLNDGVPGTSFYVVGGMMGGAPPMTPPSVAGYASVPSPHTYEFIPPHAGTYMYHCHVDTVLHMEMGMSGTIIVRPADGSANTVWTGGPQFDKEYIWHLHTYDSTWHMLMQSSAATARYRPDYFLINGMEGNNLLTDSATVVQAAPNERVLIRLVNLGYLSATVGLGGISFEAVSSDGRPLLTPRTANSLEIGPGERYDIIFTMPATVSSATVSYSNITGLGSLGTAATVIVPV